MRRRTFLSSAVLPFFMERLEGDDSPRCILVRMPGGASHIDTFDMKPDAPSEIRGPFRAIKTNVSGIEISEIFPRLAKHAEKFAIIRSVHHAETSHTEAEKLFHLPAVDTFQAVFSDKSWDAHGWEPFSGVSAYKDSVAPAFDRQFGNLLEDLSDRGLLLSTLVVALGEFGRSPKVNSAGGRDHWPHCFSVLIAGGGIRGGQVYGSSDRSGAEPRDNPVTPPMLHATIRKALKLPSTPDSASAIDSLFV
jgi:hypothetical protein